MKTFNSTLAIVAIALTSVFGFTSCDKDNEAFNNGSTINKGPIYNAPEPQPAEPFANTPKGTTTTNPTPEKAGVAAKDYAGTYKCTSDEGKEWMIVLTENATASEGKYTATITVPEGEEVAAQTYDGYFKVINSCVLFYSTGTKGGSDNNNIVNFKLSSNEDNAKNFTALVHLNNRGTLKTLVFAKQ